MNDTFICTYSDKLKHFQKYIKADDMAYFGNIKGKNNWSHKHNCIHIGFNRKADYVYLQKYILLKNKTKEWNELSNDLIEKDLESILELDKGRFVDPDMDAIFRSDVVVDIEQNIMRIKCRHFSNEEICNIYLVCNSNIYYDIINRLADRLGVEVDEHIVLDLEKSKSDERKNKSKYLIAFEDWLKIQPIGREFKINELYNETIINLESLKTIKKTHKHIKEWFDKHKVKKGIYKI